MTKTAALKQMIFKAIEASIDADGLAIVKEARARKATQARVLEKYAKICRKVTSNRKRGR